MCKTTENPFTQLCVWPNNNLGDSTPEQFEEIMLKELGWRVKFADIVTTLPDMDEVGNEVPETGGREDLFFYLHTDDIEKAAVYRLGMGIRWWEDVVGNGNHVIYPKEIQKKYNTTW